ncbi:hypothetical protein BKA70DRAFT_1442163 [Coprinopsis sp. MPI-PUGE-AT-0042]|nr:hypothetical protein BKA70DRAFT_1442163 [Coprinopsis sp. MPI-PUGE-AT-0042]
MSSQMELPFRCNYDCNGTAAQKWVFNQNQVQAQIRLANTNFCLDAGDNPFQRSGNKLKIWDCHSTALTWECFLNNKNQLWQSGLSVMSSSLPPIVTSVSMTATPTGPIIMPPPTYTNDYPRPGCPVYSCGGCPPSYRNTIIALEPPLVCHECGCVSTPSATRTPPLATPGGDYPRPGCPVYSCSPCPTIMTAAFVAENPNVCHACACVYGPGLPPSLFESV